MTPEDIEVLKESVRSDSSIDAKTQEEVLQALDLTVPIIRGAQQALAGADRAYFGSGPRTKERMLAEGVGNALRGPLTDLEVCP